MNDDDLIPLTVIELRASLLLAATFSALFVAQLDPRKHNEKTGRKAVEDEIEKIIKMAIERPRP